MTPAAPIRITLAGEAALDDFVEVLEAAAVWLWDRDIPHWEPGSMRAQRATFRAPSRSPSETRVPAISMRSTPTSSSSMRASWSFSSGV